MWNWNWTIIFKLFLCLLILLKLGFRFIITDRLELVYQLALDVALELDAVLV